MNLSDNTLGDVLSSSDPHDPALYEGRRMSEDDKLLFLKSTCKPLSGLKFPVTSGRRFNPTWLEGRPWLRYSIRNDSLYCTSCMCFSTSSESPFVSKGFKNWKKALGKHGYIDQHRSSECHKISDEKAASFLQTQLPGTDIMARINKHISEQQIQTKKGILAIIDVILALGQRGIALRGNWDKKEACEDGNFMYFVKWKATFDQDLKHHLDNSKDNARYTSPRIQNEIIQLTEDLIREKILACIPKYWSLMADETQDCSTSEQVSICIRYVNTKGEVCEDFAGFIQLERMDAQTIANRLLSTVEGWGLNMSGLIAQGYDGASVMSGSRNGVQAKVREKYPNVTYVHCRSHVLNLAVSSGCNNVPSIRNLFDSVQKLTWFLGGSAKRKAIFVEVASTRRDDQKALLDLLTETDCTEKVSESAQALKEGRKKSTVPKFCATRWTARISTLSALLSKYIDVIKALEKIRDSSSADARSDAASYIRLLEDSQFLVALGVAQFVLSYLGSVTTSLQSVHCNLVDAYNDVKLARKCIQDSRTDSCWGQVWTRVNHLASATGITVVKPRTARVQCHRANAGASDQSCSDYYKVNVYYPFVDHVISELDTRFSDHHEGLVAVQYLVPTLLSKLTQEKVELIKQYYGQYLSFEEREVLDTEITKWKKSFEGILIGEESNHVNATLSKCSPQIFPTLHKIFTIFLTTPVGSVSCERSFSALRRLKLWTRSTMREDRLSGLAMILIHRNTEYIPSPEEIYSRKTNWRQFRI